MNYSLRPNRFTENPNDQTASVEHAGTATIDTIIDRMVAEGGAIKESEARSNILEFFKATNYYLSQGYTISLDYFKARFSISGVFTDTNDTFDANRHQLNIKMSAGKFLKEVVGNVPLNKVKGSTVSINIDRVQDYMSKTNDDVLTSGGMVRILGDRLFIDTSDDNQGVFLIAEDRTETKIEFLQQISYGELMVQIPMGLAAGTYRLEIRSIIRGQTSLSKGLVDDLEVVAPGTAATPDAA